MSTKLTRTEAEYREMRHKMRMYKGIVRRLNASVRNYKLEAEEAKRKMKGGGDCFCPR